MDKTGFLRGMTIVYWIQVRLFDLILDSGSFDDLEALVAANVEQCDYGYVCLLCSKTIPLRQNMINHMMEQHLRPQEYKCPPCGLVFKNRELSTDHFKMYHMYTKK